MRFPKNKADFEAMLQSRFADGSRVGFVAGQEAERALKERRRAEEHLACLKAIRDLLSTAGQAAGELSRAMQSEKGQL